MERPNEEQVQAATAILKEHKRIYGMAGAEGSERRAVYSILAALGGPGNVHEEFHAAIKAKEVEIAKGESIDPADADTTENPTPPWFTVTTDQEVGTAMIEVTGDNEHGFAVGDVFEYTGENTDPEEEAEDEATVLTKSDFDAMNKEELVAKYGESHDLTMDMTREDMWDAVKPADADDD